MQKLVINCASGEKRYALLKDNKVDKIMIDQPVSESIVGNIYLGVVTKVLPGMNAAFIDIGHEKNAFLQRNKLASYVRSDEPGKEKKAISSFTHQGEKLIVQVDKDASGTKGPRVTGIIEFQGESMIYMPFGRYVAVSKKVEQEQKRSDLRQIGDTIKKDAEGIIFRTSAAELHEDELKKELEKLRTEYSSLEKRSLSFKKAGLLTKKDSFLEMLHDDIVQMESGEVISDDVNLKRQLEDHYSKINKKIAFSFYNAKENIFSAYRIESEMIKALKRIVWMDNGSYLIFDETEALTIIDVNTGKYSGKNNLQETVLKTNRLAANEIARQLRLRDIGGIVLIDFIDMVSDDERDLIMKTVKSALEQDEKQTKLIGFTPLGILQLTRKKTKVSLSEAMTERCPVCEGTGKMVSAETVAFRLERELWEHRMSEFEAVEIETHSKVREVFSGLDDQHKNLLEHSIGLKIYFTVKSELPFDYRIKKFGTVKEIERNIKECD